MRNFGSWFKGPSNTSRSENIEDYAIKKIPSHYRWPIPAIILVLIGNSTALFFFTFGTKLSFTVGWPIMLLPLGYLFIGASLIGMVMIHLASKEGLTVDMMTRGMGFGYIGSSVTSLIYGINFIFYFILEGTIVTNAIAFSFNLTVHSFESNMIFAGVGLLKLVLVWYGMKELQIFQTWGVLIYSALLGVAIYLLITNFDVAGPSQWLPLEPISVDSLGMAFMLANGQVVFQGLMATDYARFAKSDTGYRGGFLCMVGMLAPMIGNILIGPLFAYTLMYSMKEESAMTFADPGFIFPLIIGVWGTFFVLITQIRINVMNLYSASLALSNSFSLIFNFTPGRPWWMVAVYILSCLFYAVNFLNYIDVFLAVTGILTNTWILIILVDHFICRKLLNYGPSDFIEYRRPFLYKWNPTGVFSLAVGVIVGGVGILEIYPIYYSSFLAMIVGSLLHIILTISTKGQFYFTRFPMDRETEWNKFPR
ncbi:purine-cytosine permease family protein [Peribacillus glennii]|uniref:Allantoin permease n=1 Tax=Peribacillus glennii TaxID=2303991 RepID=A0A372LJG5_9BACI|nr:allantoin permease [Peribacillus glennii]RFU66588.1 allantoin permease [Peribacillus glennii]